MNIYNLSEHIMTATVKEKEEDKISHTSNNSVSEVDYLTCKRQVFCLNRLQTRHLQHVRMAKRSKVMKITSVLCE